MKQNAASFCRSRVSIVSRIPDPARGASAQNGCIMSRPSVFGTLCSRPKACPRKDLRASRAVVAKTKREKPRASEGFVARTQLAHIQNAGARSRQPAPARVDRRQHVEKTSWRTGNIPPLSERSDRTYHEFTLFSGVRPEITYAFNAYPFQNTSVGAPTDPPFRLVPAVAGHCQS